MHSSLKLPSPVNGAYESGNPSTTPAAVVARNDECTALRTLMRMPCMKLAKTGDRFMSLKKLSESLTFVCVVSLTSPDHPIGDGVKGMKKAVPPTSFPVGATARCCGPEGLVTVQA